jgi:hypothetical protein
VTEGEDRPLVGIEAVERRGERPGVPFRGREAGRAWVRRNGHCDRVQPTDLTDGASASAADRHSSRIHRDPGQPGLEPRRISEFAHLPPGDDERLLRGVGGIGLVADYGEGQAVHGTNPVSDDRLECFEISPAGTLDDARVQRGADGMTSCVTYLMPLAGFGSSCSRTMVLMPAIPKLNNDYERRAYWHATMPALPDRSGRDLPDVVDALVIGGGYTGVAAARKLALQGSRVVLLEAYTLGWGASTRNGGIAHPGYKWGPRTLTKRHGPALARAIYDESVAATELVAGLIRDQDIDAELRFNGYLELAWAPSHAADFEAEAASLGEFGTTARSIPKDRLREEIGTNAYHGGMAVDAGGVLHPAKWFVGLVGLAERAGAELHEGVRATSIRQQADGRFVVETERGAILARDVLVATNGYTDGVAPSLRRRIIPIGSYIIATEPLPEALARELSPTGRAYFDK